MAKMKVPGGRMVGVLPDAPDEKATEKATEKKSRKPKQETPEAEKPAE